MKKLPLLILSMVLLSACNQSDEYSSDLRIVGDTPTTSDDPVVEPVILPTLTVVPTQAALPEGYHEIETSLDFNSFNEGGYYMKVINEEIERLKNQGQAFWFDSSKLIAREVMHQVQAQREECGDSSDRDCPIEALTANPKFLPEGYKTKDCFDDGHLRVNDKIDLSDEPCIIKKPKLPKKFLNRLMSIAEIYAGPDANYYTVGTMKDDEQYTIYKNDEALFTAQMSFSPIGVTEEAVMALDSPAFTFNSNEFLKNGNEVNDTRDIFYKGETLNKKYDLQGASHLFSYKDKIGLVGEKESKTSLYFNGKKVSQDFDKITTIACCMSFAYPIEVDENGILFFMAERDEKLYFVEVDLNKYL